MAMALRLWLALSGLTELFFAVWFAIARGSHPLIKWMSAAAMDTAAPAFDQVALFLALGCLLAAALQALALRWHMQDREETYTLINVYGVFAVLSGLVLALMLASAKSAAGVPAIWLPLVADSLRGVILLLIANVEHYSPQTLKKLSLPKSATGSGREVSEHREARGREEWRGSRGRRDGRGGREWRDRRGGRGPRDGRRDERGPRDARDERGTREPREPREPREALEPREDRGPRDGRDARNGRGPQREEGAPREERDRGGMRHRRGGRDRHRVEGGGMPSENGTRRPDTNGAAPGTSNGGSDRDARRHRRGRRGSRTRRGEGGAPPAAQSGSSDSAAQPPPARAREPVAPIAPDALPGLIEHAPGSTGEGPGVVRVINPTEFEAGRRRKVGRYSIQGAMFRPRPKRVHRPLGGGR
jgi:hypothetical protein